MSFPPTPDLEKVRFLVDADLVGVGRGLMCLRNDVAVAGQAPTKDMPHHDEDWIPVVARYGWVAITADRHIRTRPFEAEAAVAHGLRCVHLKPPKRDAARWDFVRVLAAHWEAVEGMCHRDGPDWLEVSMRNTRHLRYEPGQPPRLPPR